MAHRYRAPSGRIPLSRNDHEWLAGFAAGEDTSVQTVVEALRFFRYWQARGKQTFKEALELIDLQRGEYQEQVRRRRYFEREYQVQSRRLYNMRRAYEKRLWQERGIRRVYEKRLRQERIIRHAYESQLQQERIIRHAYEKQLQRQRSYFEQEERTTQSQRDAPYGPTVAKLLALAVCSDSDGEAKAALEKARALHRLAA